MSDVLQDRYGRPSPHRRTVIVAATTVLAVVFLAWLAWAAWFGRDDAVNAEVNSFEVVSTHEVRVKLDPDLRDAEVRGTCLVRATARDHTIVGELNVSAARLRASVGQWIPVRTERRATTVEVVRCTAD
ncbi:MAG: DUF4307 domain-containing protein [Marmoricola sp.]